MLIFKSLSFTMPYAAEVLKAMAVMSPAPRPALPCTAMERLLPPRRPERVINWGPSSWE